jgi:hypothetical protein
MIRKAGLLVLALWSLSGCGGGGGGGGSAPPPPPPSPTISFPTTTFTFSAASPSAGIPSEQIVTAAVTNVTSGTLYIIVAAGDPAIATVSNFVVTGTTTGQATLSAGYPAKLGMGTHTTTFAVTACLNDPQCKTGTLMGSPATITVNYQVGSPVQRDTLMPAVGISNTAGHLILRGSSFTGVTGVLFGTTTATSVSVVNDTEIHADYPAMTAGSLAVTLQKGSANTVFGANFTVVDPLGLSGTTLALPASPGTKFIVNSLAFDAVHSALFVGMWTLDTAVPPNLTPANNVILRYPYTAGAWLAPTVTAWPNLRVTALSPDGQTLLAATDGAIDLLNAVTLVSAGSSTKPVVSNEYIRMLAFTNDGNVVVATGYANGSGSTSTYLYSLHDSTFSLPKLAGTGSFATNLFYYADVAASADGSVAELAQPLSATPLQQYLASTGQWVASSTPFNYYLQITGWNLTGIVIDERADRLILQDGTVGGGSPNLLVLNASLNQTGIAATGSEGVLISRDGSRAYVLAITQSTPATCSVRSFDLTTSPSSPTGLYNEITTRGYPIARPCLSDTNSPSVGALSPDGKTLFVGAGAGISVISLP